jgi:TolB protein
MRERSFDRGEGARARFAVTAMAIAATMVALWPARVGAQLQVDITAGVTDPIPIAVQPFEDDAAALAQIIAADLGRSGRFIIRPRNEADYLVTGRSASAASGASGGALAIGFELQNLLTGQALLKENLSAPAAATRQAAHRIADRIYLRLIGQRSAFATRIAYVIVEGLPPQRRYRLMVADADGATPRVVLESRRPLMSPAWSPDGRWLAYVSFETRSAAVYVQDLRTAERRVVSRRPGVNGAPAWSPDGTRLALTLSSPTGNLDIHLLDPRDGTLERLTDDPAIDTEPVWSADGRTILFTSDRAGGPQVYRMTARAGERAQRITFGTPYAARPRLSPDGRLLAVVVRDEGGYRIAVQPLAGGERRVLSRGPQDESPAFSPDGGTLIYAARAGGSGTLEAVTIDGLVRYRLQSPGLDAREPSWGPFPPAVP